MDGVHDLGGMHGFGAVEREANEPAFHAQWEAVVVAIQRAGLGPFYNIDEFRHAIERMEPARYLDSSYYERWFDGISRLLVEKGVVGREELETRAAFFRDHPGAPATAALTAPPPLSTTPGGLSPQTFFRPASAPPRFAVGDRVVTRTLRGLGHTRLPRYARGKRGVIAASRGVCVLPDSNAHLQGEQPEPLYGVAFSAGELWGPTAEGNGTVFIDLWESYLEPDSGRSETGAGQR